MKFYDWKQEMCWTEVIKTQWHQSEIYKWMKLGMWYSWVQICSSTAGFFIIQGKKVTLPCSTTTLSTTTWSTLIFSTVTQSSTVQGPNGPHIEHSKHSNGSLEASQTPDYTFFINKSSLLRVSFHRRNPRCAGVHTRRSRKREEEKEKSSSSTVQHIELNPPLYRTEHRCETVGNRFLVLWRCRGEFNTIKILYPKYH